MEAERDGADSHPRRRFLVIEPGLDLEGRCTVESPMGDVDVHIAPGDIRIVPSGPMTVLRALLWLARGRRRRAVRSVARQLAAFTGYPVRVRLLPGVHVPLAG